MMILTDAIVWGGDDFYATRKSGKGSKMFDAKKSQLEWMGYFVARTRGDDFSHNIWSKNRKRRRTWRAKDQDIPRIFGANPHIALSVSKRLRILKEEQGGNILQAIRTSVFPPDFPRASREAKAIQSTCPGWMCTCTPAHPWTCPLRNCTRKYFSGPSRSTHCCGQNGLTWADWISPWRQQKWLSVYFFGLGIHRLTYFRPLLLNYRSVFLWFQYVFFLWFFANFPLLVLISVFA